MDYPVDKANDKKVPKAKVFDESKLSASPFIRALWTLAGTIFLGLGIVGIILPLLPTTPFLLLAAYCYLRGSERMHTWLLSNRWFGEYISNYKEKKGIPLKIKITVISVLWITITISVFFFTEILWVRIILIVIASAVTYYIVTLKTLK